MHNPGTFLHTVKPFLTADRFDAIVDNDDIHINGWIDRETGTKIYIVQHEQTNSTELTKYVLLHMASLLCYTKLLVIYEGSVSRSTVN